MRAERVQTVRQSFVPSPRESGQRASKELQHIENNCLASPSEAPACRLQILQEMKPNDKAHDLLKLPGKTR
jgi:hypothetical protein